MVAQNIGSLALFAFQIIHNFFLETDLHAFLLCATEQKLSKINHNSTENPRMAQKMLVALYFSLKSS